MRIAILSDIHDNLTAFQAVLSDLREVSPDLVLHGGDLVGGGSHPQEIVDQIRDLGWPGVFGNTDEAVFNPESLEAFATASRAPASLWNAIREMTAFTRDALGDERIAWLRTLPLQFARPEHALIHASPSSAWRSPDANATAPDLTATYDSLSKPLVVYGHVHTPFMRNLNGLTVINTGSVSQSFDGDPRASYLLIDDGAPSIRRVEYDVEREIKLLATSGLPHWGWTARTLRTARPQLP